MYCVVGHNIVSTTFSYILYGLLSDAIRTRDINIVALTTGTRTCTQHPYTDLRRRRRRHNNVRLPQRSLSYETEKLSAAALYGCVCVRLCVRDNHTLVPRARRRSPRAILLMAKLSLDNIAHFVCTPDPFVDGDVIY